MAQGMGDTADAPVHGKRMQAHCIQTGGFHTEYQQAERQVLGEVGVHGHGTRRPRVAAIADPDLQLPVRGQVWMLHETDIRGGIEVSIDTLGRILASRAG